ncbi:hypothetical protein SeMB42_g02940 [Synchytrium endobioticum]|uniref:Large ribosomal subunit protein uL23m n=1 Tax=Synchytrium endobioticum TaxID=286115 RepID=A0A507DAF6_9FUNG|nr:hypothetical protein SeLEV6574_g04521 [Synchytrium endobioticum]TPX48622.1 hypothetical protein SeMB42_g02940 [Synchytrium endobioticum]
MSLHSGQKLFFPNIIFRLVRSNLPPNQALFRIPRNVNKLDVKAYLKSIYNVDVTDVRTANYLSKKAADPKASAQNRRVLTVKVPAYKRAIVTMTKDFVFPPIPRIGDNGVQPLATQNMSAYPAKNKDVAKIEFFQEFFTEMSKLSRDAEAEERGEKSKQTEPPRRRGYLSAKRKRIIDASIAPLRRAIRNKMNDKRALQDIASQKT